VLAVPRVEHALHPVPGELTGRLGQGAPVLARHLREQLLQPSHPDIKILIGPTTRSTTYTTKITKCGWRI
jgi:hypothetical protein